jgi:hypothetical protein
MRREVSLQFYGEENFDRPIRYDVSGNIVLGYLEERQNIDNSY